MDARARARTQSESESESCLSSTLFLLLPVISGRRTVFLLPCQNSTSDPPPTQPAVVRCLHLVAADGLARRVPSAPYTDTLTLSLSLPLSLIYPDLNGARALLER